MTRRETKHDYNITTFHRSPELFKGAKKTLSRNILFEEDAPEFYDDPASNPAMGFDEGKHNRHLITIDEK